MPTPPGSEPGQQSETNQESSTPSTHLSWDTQPDPISPYFRGWHIPVRETQSNPPLQPSSHTSRRGWPCGIHILWSLRMNGVGSIHSTLQNVKNLGKVTASAYSSQEEPLSALPNSRVLSQGNMTLRLGPLVASAPRTPRGNHRGSMDPPKAPEEQGLTAAGLSSPSLHSFPITVLTAILFASPPSPHSHDGDGPPGRGS